VGREVARIDPDPDPEDAPDEPAPEPAVAGGATNITEIKARVPMTPSVRFLLEVAVTRMSLTPSGPRSR
jgi:hypothetical protein